MNRSNHHPHDIPLDGISYHQYVIGDGTNMATLAADFFGTMDAFVEEVTKIEGIKALLSPDTKTFINEIGCGSFHASTYTQPNYYVLCAATFVARSTEPRTHAKTLHVHCRATNGRKCCSVLRLVMP